jgi:class 3 adenylate cyclase
MSTRTVTLLFCDLVDSTSLLSRLSEERSNEVRRDHFSALRDAVGVHGGVEVKSLGDGLMVSFSSAAEAVAAAAAMQRSIARLARRDPSVGLSLRAGISIGEATLEDGDWFGTPVVEAARLCAAARPAQILVNDLVPAIIRAAGRSDFEPVGPVSLKGLPDPVLASSVHWDVRGGFRPPLPDPLDTSKRFVFVGRSAEMAMLQESWRHSLAGTAGLVLVAGEPGVGKTRLVAELAGRVHAADGAAVLYGRCDEELGVPYQPFVDALHALVVGCPADELRDFVGADGADLTRLVPRVADRLALVRPDDGDETDTGRFRMFEAVRAVLARVSLAVPLLLVLDDLQWAAKPTLLLLRHIVRVASPGLLAVGTFRDTDLDRTHPLAGMLADLRREPHVARVQLTGLSEAEVKEFVEIAAGHAFDVSIVELTKAIHVETEGNPLFVGQLLRHLTDSGGLVQRDGHWSTSRPLGELGIPEGVRELIGQRLSRLSPTANDVLGVASVIGRSFDTTVLTAAGGVEPDDVLDVLAAAEQARLIALVPGRVDRYTFVHALVRSTLYRELPTSRRLRLHRRVGLELEARGAGNDSQRWAELAGHFFEAASLGEVDRAVHYGKLAGGRARAGLAFEEAAAHYENALGALELLDEPDRAVRADVQLALGNALRRAGDDRFREIVLDVARDARSLDDGRLLARAALSLTGADTSAAGPVDQPLVAMLEEALAHVPADDSVLRAQLLAATAAELIWDPAQQDRRARMSEEAVAIVRRVGDHQAVAHVLTATHWASFRPDNLEERLSIADELVSLAEALGHIEARLYGHVARFGDLVELGDLARADIDLDAARVLSAQLHRPMFMWGVIAYATAGRALLAGRIDDADEAMAAAADASLRAGVSGHAIRRNSDSLRCLLLWEKGQHGEALAVVEAMVAAVPDEPFWHVLHAALLVEVGRTADAQSIYDKCMAEPGPPLDPTWLSAMVLLAETACALGDRAGADRLYQRLEPFAGRIAWNNVGAFGLVDLALARLRLTSGDAAAAARHAASAAHLADRINAPRWLARTQSLDCRTP